MGGMKLYPRQSEQPRGRGNGTHPFRGRRRYWTCIPVALVIEQNERNF